jgi:M3 family oligoendopeptidase
LENYIPLAYLSNGRSDYSVADVESFRNSVRKHLVPLFNEYMRTKTARMGKPTIKPWDVAYDPDLTIPLGVVPVETQLDKAGKIFNSISPHLYAYFKKMRDLKLIDLESRPNKHPNPFCTHFPDQGIPAILCNSTGDAEDVRTLVHEMGHAFQTWESADIESIDLQQGTADLAEINSMGMEFLSLPYIDEFFKPEDAAKFRAEKVIDTIYTLVYVCVVDEFQHWVYENHDATVAERDDAWIKIHSEYLGPIDFTGLEKYQRTRWYLQMHIFGMPFYYIDYALAESCAIQLGLLDTKDHGAAIEAYLKLCRIGGTMGFLTAIKSAGLKSPFQEETITDLASFVKEHLSNL